MPETEIPELETNFLGGIYYTVKGEGVPLTKDQAKEIIRRCKCHDDLLAACEIGLIGIDWLIKRDKLNEIKSPCTMKAKQKIEAAIAKAKEVKMPKTEIPELAAMGPKYESGQKSAVVRKDGGWLTVKEAEEVIRRAKVAYEKVVEERDFLKKIVQIDVKIFDVIRDEYSQYKDLQAKLDWRKEQVDKEFEQALAKETS